MTSYFFHWVHKPPLLAFILMLKVPLIWLVGPVDTSPSFSEHFLTLQLKKIFQNHLVPSVLWPWNEPFLREAMVPCSWKWYLKKSWGRSILIAIRVLLFLSLLSES